MLGREAVGIGHDSVYRCSHGPPVVLGGQDRPSLGFGRPAPAIGELFVPEGGVADMVAAETKGGVGEKCFDLGCELWYWATIQDK